MRSTPAAKIRPNSVSRASVDIRVGHRLFGPELELRMVTPRPSEDFDKRYANKA
jgi:hypothetical protein